MRPMSIVAAALFALAGGPGAFSEETPPMPTRPRLRDLGAVVGELPTGPLNAITDVAGVRVGQVTLREGERVRTGVTAVLPHGGNPFREKVPAAVHVGNGFGKLVGATQIAELGQIETPILLTNTLGVWDAARAVAGWVLALPGNEDVRSVNPVVGETNDGRLNDIRAFPVKGEHALAAIRDAKEGPVEEGSVGAGAGTICFGWKGGIGTSSRRLTADAANFTVGVLVQTNYGGRLEILGVPVGKELAEEPGRTEDRGDGSCMIVVATDAPLDARQLGRLAGRALLALARTGSVMDHGSGDYAIAFSTANSVRIRAADPPVRPADRLREDALTPLFRAAVEATEEAIYNSLLKATDAGTVKAIPIERVREILKKYGKIKM